MKRFIVVILMGILLTACGANDETSKQSDEKEAQKTDSEKIEEVISSKDNPEKFDKVFSDPDKYKNYGIEFTGKVFDQPERDSDGVYMQIFADPEQQDQNVIVGINNSDLKNDVKVDDYVRVKGVINDTYEGENAFGGEIRGPSVLADDIEIVDYVTAVSPTIETIDVDKTQDQSGFVVDVDKVELADNMTRVYITVKNNTDDEINLFEHESKLVIDNEQIEIDNSFYNTGLPKIDNGILPDTKSEGVLIFPSIDPETESMMLHTKGMSENYELDLEPFEFKIEH